MKTIYKPNKDLYKQYYCGHGSFPVFEGVIHQRGYGLGNFLSGIFRGAIPIFKRIGKSVGKELLKGGAEVAGDVLAGENIKSALKKRASQRISKFLASQEGQGYARKRIKRARKVDIFDD